MTDLLAIPAELSEVKVKRLSQLLLKVESQENLDPEQIAKFSVNAGKYGWLTFSPEKPLPDEILNLPPLPSRGRKSYAERLRSVLFVSWKQNGFGEFDDFYETTMEKIIDFYKSKLN